MLDTRMFRSGAFIRLDNPRAQTVYEVLMVRTVGKLTSAQKEIVVEDVIGRTCTSCFGTGREYCSSKACKMCNCEGQIHNRRTLTERDLASFKLVEREPARIPVAVS